MAVAITVTKEVDGAHCDVALSGLTVNTAYDVYRLQLRYLGEDDTGTPLYERELPDRPSLWSAVAHRINWKATAATLSFRDYEAPARPFVYFVVPYASVGPAEYTAWETEYPVSRGTLSADVVHFSYADPDLYNPGDLLIRSTADPLLFATPCLVEMVGPRYTARGTEQAVMGRQYPVYVADTREARRGSVTVMTDSLGGYDDLRAIVFPTTGRILPIKLSSCGDQSLLLDDMLCIPLDVEVEQATQKDAGLRYVRVDYVEIDPRPPQIIRLNDVDTPATIPAAPRANFTVSDTTPKSNQWITLTSTSTGTISRYEWTVSRGDSSNKVHKYYTRGPHKIRWKGDGKRTIKLRVVGPAGASVKMVKVTVK